jgi:prolyl-tRNA editing enzyme YbaK/EbsC (Cys-tRNA(Pro) deacylase)
MQKLKVFVASSLEAKAEDKFVRGVLEENSVDVITWRDIFHVGEFSLDSLLNISQEIHGAIIISTPDDKVWYRGSELFAPRDNILFEMGLFIKALGAKQVALVFCKDEKGLTPKIPTDISGLNVIFFEREKKAMNETQLEKWVHNFKQVSHPMYFHFNDAVRVLKDNFQKIPSSWIDEIKNYILDPFEEMSKSALAGEFILNTNQYYDSVLTRLVNSDKSTTIRAISLVSPDIWEADPHQRRFLEHNVKADRNGAKIRRLFIATESQEAEHKKIIQEQLKLGFEIKTVNPRIFSDYANLNDSIMFEGSSEMCCYKTTQYYDNPYKLKGARLILNQTACKEQATSFDKLWKLAKEPKNLKFNLKKTSEPPGMSMKYTELSFEVTTCEEAAIARGVPLTNELKTLILITPSGFLAVHLPGDGKINLRAIKNELEIKDIRIADPEQINKIGLQPGTVSAILDPVWTMPHLISKRVLTLNYVTTNNGTKTGYYRFDPVLMLSATLTIVGNFEQ